MKDAALTAVVAVSTAEKDRIPIKWHWMISPVRTGVTYVLFVSHLVFSFVLDGPSSFKKKMVKGFTYYNENFMFCVYVMCF